MIDYNETLQLAEALSQAEIAYIVTIQDNHAVALIVGDMPGKCNECELADALEKILDLECDNEDMPQVLNRFVDLVTQEQPLEDVNLN